MTTYYHTDGTACPYDPAHCLRWHTQTPPVLNDEHGTTFPPGTQWTDRFGRDRILTDLLPCRPKLESSPRASALEEAKTLITGDRNNQYGPPTQDFKRTADLLNALGYRRVDAEDALHEILASDVALIIAQVKVSRLMHSRGKRDSWVDLAGYAACGYECAGEESDAS